MDGMAQMPAALSVTESLGGRYWRWRTAEDRLGFALSQRLAVPEIVGRIMAARGISPEDAADFLNPTLRALLPDPALMIDMEVAAERLAAAITGTETVAIFGDYDVEDRKSTRLNSSHRT